MESDPPVSVRYWYKSGASDLESEAMGAGRCTCMATPAGGSGSACSSCASPAGADGGGQRRACGAGAGPATGESAVVLLVLWEVIA